MRSERRRKRRKSVSTSTGDVRSAVEDVRDCLCRRPENLAFTPLTPYPLHFIKELPSFSFAGDAPWPDRFAYWAVEPLGDPSADILTGWYIACDVLSHDAAWRAHIATIGYVAERGELIKRVFTAAVAHSQNQGGASNIERGFFARFSRACFHGSLN